MTPTDREASSCATSACATGCRTNRRSPPKTKLALFEALVAAGVAELELTSFVRPDRVPAMADADALCAATAERRRDPLGPRPQPAGRRAGPRCRSHAPAVRRVGQRHAQPAQRRGRHRRGASPRSSARCPAWPSTVAHVVEMTLSTAFGCPYEHRIDPTRRRDGAPGGRRRGVVDRPGRHDRCGRPAPRSSRWSMRSRRRSTCRSVRTSTTPGAWRSPTPSPRSTTAWSVSMPASVDSVAARSPRARAATSRSRISRTHSARWVCQTGCSVHGLIEAASSPAPPSVARASHVGVAGPRFVTSHRMAPDSERTGACRT